MTITSETGLARLTIVAPSSRADLALPDGVPLASLLPVLLDVVGESLSEAGDSAVVGWRLCRADGTRLNIGRSLAAQQIKDGEALHLVPHDADWPEPEYDDVVLSIAEGTDRLGGRWSTVHTRAAGLGAASVTLLVGLLVLLRSGPDWSTPALVALAVAALAALAGVIVSRAVGDSRLGAVLAATAMPYAAVGGWLALGAHRRLTDFGAAHLLVGCAALLLVGVVGVIGVADLTGVFLAGVISALLGSLGASLTILSVSAGAAAAVVVAVALALMSMSAGLAIRLAELRMPDLPQDARDLLADRPVPAAATIFAAVARADEILTGLLLAVAVTVTGCVLVLRAGGGVVGPLLAAIVSTLLLLRARALPRLRHRCALLISGGIGLALTLLGVADRLAPANRPTLVLAGLVPAAVLLVGSATRYSRRRPGPRLGRVADTLELVLTLSVVPIVAVALGLVGYFRGLGG